jgi:hypothetical protein
MIEEKKVLTAGGKKVLPTLSFLSLFFPPPDLSFSQKILSKRRVLTAGGKKVLPTSSFLSLYSLHQIHLFLQNH